MPKPQPPAEALLIRLARDAGRLTVPAAARAAQISKARWAQIEAGYETRKDGYHPVRAPAGTLAHMARAVGISPERLETEGERPDAAGVLREIMRGHEPPPALAVPSPDGPAQSPGSESVDGLTPEEARITREFIEAIRRSRRDDGGHQQDGAGG